MASVSAKAVHNILRFHNKLMEVVFVVLKILNGRAAALMPLKNKQ
jgi:hypothetical protein